MGIETLFDFITDFLIVNIADDILNSATRINFDPSSAK